MKRWIEYSFRLRRRAGLVLVCLCSLILLSGYFVSRAEHPSQPLQQEAERFDETAAADASQGKIAFVGARGGIREDIYVMNKDGSNQTNLTKSYTVEQTPKWSPDGQRLAFTSSQAGYSQSDSLTVMNADGSEKKHIIPPKIFGHSSIYGYSWSPDGTKILYWGSPQDIQVVNADGSNHRNLTASSLTAELDAAWSPDGTRIAFAKYQNDESQIFDMNPDGSNQLQLTFDAGRHLNPTWSPDSRKIAYLRWLNQKTELFVMNSDGSGQVKLADVPLETPLAWSPDGKYIAFNSKPASNSTLWQIHLVKPDGSELKPLTTGANDRDFSWSPDSKQILFSGIASNRLSDIFVINTDGSNLKNLTNSDASETAPAWSPDGSRITFSSNRDYKETPRQIDIFVTEPYSEAPPVRLTNDPAPEFNPAWSPDGKQIAFIKGESNEGELYVMNADGSQQTRLTYNSVSDQSPVWTPDGTRIAFSSAYSDIYTIRPDGTDLVNLNPYLTGAANPTFSPDGKRIAYNCKTGLCLMNADGSNPKSLRQRGEYGYGPLAWSPDGQYIAYIALNSSGYDVVVIIKPDGTGSRVVGRVSRDCNNPAWSPDSSRVIFDASETLYSFERDSDEGSVLIPSEEPSFDADWLSPTSAPIPTPTPTPTTTPTPVTTRTVVISEIYPTSSVIFDRHLKNDFVELFNYGNTTVDLTGWSLQYAAFPRTTWQVANLSGSIAPGQYYLVQLAQGNSTGDALPAADATADIDLDNLSATVALVSTTTPITAPCPLSTETIIDLVGYGDDYAYFPYRACAEGTSVERLNWESKHSAQRKGNGCQETNDNRADFVAAPTNPRNTSSPRNTSCSGLPARGPLPVNGLRQNADIGNVGLAGYAGSGHDPHSYLVNGAGADIWGTEDSFNYVYTSFSGNVEIIARVTSVENTHPFAKAGIMIRETLDKNSKHVILSVKPNGEAEFMKRDATGGQTSYLGGVQRTLPYWLKLTRNSDQIIGETSTDGVNWVQVGSTPLTMSGGYVGLAVTSHNPTTLCTATFDNVSVTTPNEIEFREVEYHSGEGGDYISVNVVRLGNTSGPATVDYMTSDEAGLVSCTQALGHASERCDYLTTAGTLRFVSGQTINHIDIPLIRDHYIEGPEKFSIRLTNVTGARLGVRDRATINLIDAAPDSGNPLDNPRLFIRQQYIDFLGRQFDTDGFNNWLATLQNCPGGGYGTQHPTCDRVHISMGFFLSEEFLGRGYWVYRFYETSLGRRPLYKEFVPEMSRIGGAQSPESEALSKQEFVDDWVERPEFKTIYQGLSNSAYVDKLLQTAGVSLSKRDALIAALDSDQKTRAEVLREIVESKEVEDRFYIRGIVSMQYFGYLRRDPDPTGFNNWVETLTNRAGDLRHMVFGFLYSNEYRERFGQP
jgi:Tol biopolymer transport system component